MYKLLLEYCEGGDLVNYLKFAIFNNIKSSRYEKTNITKLETNAKIIGYQLFQALDYLHQVGIIHRDIKLENILLKFPDKITCLKLADFGLAKKYKNVADCCSEIRGTSSYLAPEVLTSNDDPFDVIHKYNEKCDLWSTGIIIYELLTCINPFIQYSVGKLISEYEKKGEQFISSHFTPLKF